MTLRASRQDSSRRSEPRVSVWLELHTDREPAAVGGEHAPIRHREGQRPVAIHAKPWRKPITPRRCRDRLMDCFTSKHTDVQVARAGASGILPRAPLVHPCTSQDAQERPFAMTVWGHREPAVPVRLERHANHQPAAVRGEHVGSAPAALEPTYIPGWRTMPSRQSVGSSREAEEPTPCSAIPLGYPTRPIRFPESRVPSPAVPIVTPKPAVLYCAALGARCSARRRGGIGRLAQR